MAGKIAFFDFDGTITTRDSLKEFIVFLHGKSAFYTGIVKIFPELMAFKLGLIDRQRAKEKLLTLFFSGMTQVEFYEKAAEFADKKIPGLIRPGAWKALENHAKDGNKIVIVSASPTAWVAPWSRKNGFEQICTELEVKDGKISGLILGKNCHGTEKVKRINEKFALTDFDEIYAYGDSSGDKPMLSLAKHRFYKPFRH